jgi:TetR/AcrR family transcriptional regulator, fatty acid metabolism regulator protein
VARRSSDELKDVIRDFRRDQIIRVATRLFGERGSVDVPMDEIAAEAGVARSTVYVYFTSRDELLQACLQRMYELLQAGLQAGRETEDTAPARLRTTIRGLLEQIDQNPAFFRLAMATQAAGNPTSAEAVDAQLSSIALHLAQHLMDIVDDGIRDGSFHKIDPERAATLIGQQLLGALMVRAGEPSSLPRDGASAEIAEFLLTGLAAAGT